LNAHGKQESERTDKQKFFEEVEKRRPGIGVIIGAEW
jgi:hypothetical protein